MCESQNQHHGAGQELGSGRRAFGPADAACGGVQEENDCEYDRGGTEYGAHESPFMGEGSSPIGVGWARFKGAAAEGVRVEWEVWASCHSSRHIS